MLKSRRIFSSSEEFRDEFLKSLIPGIISRNNFISWNLIKTKIDQYRKFFSFFKELPIDDKDKFAEELSGSFCSFDKPFELIRVCFEILGHTDNKKFVSKVDNIKFNNYSSIISINEARYIAEVLYDLGITKVIDTEIKDYFLGIQVGLETNRRKNVGGSAYNSFIKTELEKMIPQFRDKGLPILLKEEEKIFYSDGITSKKVDFCFLCKNKKIGIEVNFYTVSGSKPTEIKRSYGLVNSELAKVGAELAWITDGIGYEDMKNSLKESFDIHKNIYNYQMMSNHFADDVICCFGHSR